MQIRPVLLPTQQYKNHILPAMRCSGRDTHDWIVSKSSNVHITDYNGPISLDSRYVTAVHLPWPLLIVWWCKAPAPPSCRFLLPQNYTPSGCHLQFVWPRHCIFLPHQPPPNMRPNPKTQSPDPKSTTTTTTPQAPQAPEEGFSGLRGQSSGYCGYQGLVHYPW